MVGANSSFGQTANAVNYAEQNIQIDFIGFDKALKALKMGYKVSRQGSEDEHTLYFAMQFPDADSKMNHPYLYKVTKEGYRYPYTLTNADIMSNLWFVFDEEEYERNLKKTNREKDLHYIMND